MGSQLINSQKDPSLSSTEPPSFDSIRSRTWLVQIAVVAGVSIGLLVIDRSVRNQGRHGGYPDRPIKVIVPFSEGGSTDTFARTMKKAVEESGLLPQRLVIINMGGAGATIGSRHVKDEEPNGYTMLVLHDTMFTAKAFGTVDYGAEAFRPIVATGENGMVIAVDATSEFETLSDLMSAAAERPDEITYGNNTGALVHFAALYLAELQNEKPAGGKAGFRFVQSGGGSKRFEDLHGQRVDASGFSVDEFWRYQSAGLRGLAFLGEERHPAFPDMPTAAEQGYDLVHTNIVYWWFPKGTPTRCVEVIADALEKAMETATMKEYMTRMQAESTVLRGDELTERIAHSRETYSTISVDDTTPLPNIPLMLLGAIGGLAGVLLFESRFPNGPKSVAAHSDLPKNHQLVFVTCILTILYVLALTVRLVDFRVITAIFLFVTGTVLARDSRRHIALIVISVLLSQTLYYVFTELFVIDLP